MDGFAGKQQEIIPSTMHVAVPENPNLTCPPSPLLGAYPSTVEGEEVAPGVWKYPVSSLMNSTIFEIIDANRIPHF
jgi:hypothetical protein